MVQRSTTNDRCRVRCIDTKCCITRARTVVPSRSRGTAAFRSVELFPYRQQAPSL